VARKDKRLARADKHPALAISGMEKLAREALDLTREILERCGPRLAGSEACERSARMLRDRLAPLCDEASVEPFEVRPDAFLGFLRVTFGLYALGTALLFLRRPVPASLAFTAGALLVVFEFLLYREVLDPLYPRRTGHNVAAFIEPRCEVKRQLIFAGHHDSARVFNLLCYLPRLYRIRLVGAFVTVAGMPISSWCWAASGRAQAWPWLGAADCVLGAVFLLPMWWFLGKEGVPGAGDNLIASAMLVPIARRLRESGGLESTRVLLFSSDAEEAGLRGARAYVRRHEQALRGLPTFLFNLESIYQADRIQFLESDLNGVQPLDQPLAAQCVALARDLGLPARTFRMYPGSGATDAAEFARVGVRATTLIAMPTDVEVDDLVYHTPRDVVAAIEPEAVEACLGIALALAKKLDAQSL
jgi:aminopeptidase YwaD